MAYSELQATEGTRVTSGTTITATYGSNVTAGSLLVAVVSRTVTSGGLTTVGEVKDNQGNHWKQAREFNGAHGGASGQQGADIWYCENAGGGNKPTVTATLLSFPVISGIGGMNMQVLEYSGNSGVELVDQSGQAVITTTSVTVTTDNNLGATNDLAISVVTGNMTAATVPSGWASRLADTTQKFWIADNTAAGTSGSTLSAAWTGLTGGSAGSALIVTFKQAGNAAGTPTLLQSSYTLPAYPLSATLTATSQPYPVNPTAGNVLICAVVGSAQVATVGGSVGGVPGNILSCEPASITDTAGNTWIKLASSGVDNLSGVDWSWFICRSAKGGATTLTATYNVLQQGTAFLLLEFANLAPNLVVDQTAGLAGRNTAVTPYTVSTPNNVKAKSVALAIMSGLLNTLNSPSSGWITLMSDTAGVGFAAMQISTAAGGLTITWSPGPSSQGVDIALVALCASAGLGAH